MTQNGSWRKMVHGAKWLMAQSCLWCKIVYGAKLLIVQNGLGLEGAWLVREGGATTCGGGAKLQSRRSLRL